MCESLQSQYGGICWEYRRIFFVEFCIFMHLRFVKIHKNGNIPIGYNRENNDYIIVNNF